MRLSECGLVGECKKELSDLKVVEHLLISNHLSNRVSAISRYMSDVDDGVLIV